MQNWNNIRTRDNCSNIRTQDNVAQLLVNHHQLLLGTCNILTFTGKKIEFVREAKLYYLDIMEFLQPKDVALEL